MSDECKAAKKLACIMAWPAGHSRSPLIHNYWAEKYKLKFVFKGDQASVEGNAAVKKEYAKISFKLDPSTTPGCVDMTIGAGVQKDAVIEGIYQLKDDELRICARVFGKDRPIEFSSPEGSSIVLLVLKREKP